MQNQKFKFSTKFVEQFGKIQNALQFIIEDTGIGISKDKQDIIYDKFVRLSLSNKGICKGSGLGLCIVKQFVSELNGAIELESELGKGTKFIVTLPVELPVI